MTATTATPIITPMKAGKNPLFQTAAYLAIGLGVFWVFLFLRWFTFSSFNWTPFAAELALAQWPPIVTYIIYSLFAAISFTVGIGLLCEMT